MEALILDALKDFDMFKELSQTIPLEVLSTVAEALPSSQQQIFQEFSSLIAAHQLALRVRQCSSWEEVEEAIAADPIHKNEAWALLTNEEKERIKILKITAASPLDPNCGNLVGKRVGVTAGTYRTAGVGIVECERGFGSLRILEVRMPNGKIQIAPITELREAT
jgi:hypothetical protein